MGTERFKFQVATLFWQKEIEFCDWQVHLSMPAKKDVKQALLAPKQLFAENGSADEMGDAHQTD